jgi:PAS domain S-box-containing protein
MRSWLARLTPHTLRAQLAVGLSAMAVLVVLGGATAVLALLATGQAARRFSEEQLVHAKDTLDLQQRTLQIELQAERMLAADTHAGAREAYGRILAELDALDQLTARLAVGDDAAVLDLHQSSQLFRNAAHVLAQLREAAAGPGAVDAAAAATLGAYRDELRAHAQALGRSAREQSDRLARAQQAAVLRVVEASRASAYVVVAWLAFSLLIAWFIGRVFLGRHVVARLQQVSRSLLADDTAGTDARRVPVHGDDEIGAMARAVERFLSDRRQLAATRALLEGERQRLAAIIDNTADSIVVLRDGRVQQLNRAAGQLFGLDAGQAADAPAETLLPGLDLDPAAAPGVPRDALARHRDGRTTPVEVSLNPVAADDGRLLVLVARDATLRKEAERHLIAARDAAEAARAAQAAFLTTLSHELRTPLNGILGFVQVLRRQEPLTGRQAHGLDVIEDCGQHLLMLIDDLLDLARMDKARLELRPAEVELPVLMHSVCDTVRVKAEEKGLTFAYEPAPRLPTAVLVDGKRLRQVLLNLLSNAVKFSDAGRVTLRAASVAPPGGAVTVARLRFEVEDQGIGMNASQLQRLFQPFSQVADARRRENGAGLGLAISQQLVRLMGGEIRVRSQEGEGCVFSFEVDAPVVVPAPMPAPAAAPAARGGQALSGARVLVVEDNQVNRELVTDLLAEAGALVEVAGDGKQALDLLLQHRFDAVLMDCLMPVMDGYEATRALRRQPQLRDLPVIALTANAMAEDRDKAFAAGMNDHLTKPVRVDQLVATIARWLQPSHAAAAALPAPAREAAPPAGSTRPA